MTDAICVVGISGFVGSHVAAELLARGYSVNGTLRDASTQSSAWILEQLSPFKQPGAELSLFSANLNDTNSLKHAMDGCTGVIMCAGIEVQEPSTIDLMVGGANAVLDNAIELGIERAVFTSSTGSTNPREGEPDLKNETDHWSDPDFQQSVGKFSPAAKTLMDRTVLRRMDDSGGQLRVSVINPSMITGPAFQTNPVASLKAFQAIVEGRRFADRIPNGSMSMIDVRDLAKLHVNAMEDEHAQGRYFGVKQSWHWVDILNAVQRAYPAYNLPPFPADEEMARPTQFDLTRQASLGCELKSLDEMVSAVFQELSRREMI